MARRPSQIRATSMDGALMIPGALGLRRHYDELRMPVLIMAGGGGKGAGNGDAGHLGRAAPGARAFPRHCDELRMPVLIMAGSGDKVVFKRNAVHLRQAIPGSVLRI